MREVPGNIGFYRCRKLHHYLDVLLSRGRMKRFSKSDEVELDDEAVMRFSKDDEWYAKRAVPPDAPARLAAEILDSGITLGHDERRFVKFMSRCWTSDGLSERQLDWLNSLARAAQPSVSLAPRTGAAT